MALFNKLIDYQGQDIHMLRNGQNFPVHLFFDTSSALSFDVRLTGDPSVLSYENILITKGNNELNICATSYTLNSNEKEVRNFFIKVTAVFSIDGKNYSETASILVHLHDQLVKAWLSPSTISIRQGQEVKFGILASFTDNNYADLSFYPQMTIAKVSASPKLATRLDGSCRIQVTPNSSPETISNAVSITFPDWMVNHEPQKTAIVINGNVNIHENTYNLYLHKGDSEKLSNKINILLLSDGFDGKSSASNLSAFRKIAANFQKQLIQKKTYTPWNFFHSKVNIWSCYTTCENNTSSLESEFVVIGIDDSSPLVMDLYSFINFFDSQVLIYGLSNIRINKNVGNVIQSVPLSVGEFDARIVNNGYPEQMQSFLELTNSGLPPDFPLFQNNQNNANSSNILTLARLCSRVGLPSDSDPTNFDLMYNQWDDRLLVDDVKKINQGLGTDDFFLHPYVFKIWRKLSQRKFLEKSDTSYGITNAYYKRSERLNFTPQQYVGPGITKFVPATYNEKAIKYFGQFINTIKGINGNPADFGTLYFDGGGNPTPRNHKNIKIDALLQQSNNIVILSKVRNNGVRGTNVKYEYSETVNDEVFNYHTHRSTISLENKVTTVFKCDVPTSGDDNGKFFQKPLEEQVGNSVRNTIIHEFSHNYLLDEYSNLVGNLSDQKHDIERNNILAKVKESNIQVGKELETSSHFIDGNKIRWRWPRVKKVGLGEISKENDNIDVTNSGNSYTCSVKTNVLKANDTKLGFDKTDKILLRKRFLFDSSVDDYIVGEIEDVKNVVVEGGYIQELQFKTTTSMNETQRREYDNGFIIIMPFWRGTSDEYETLMHHIIKEAMTQTSYSISSISNPGRPLVLKDTVSNNTPQVPDKEFREWNNNQDIINKMARLKSKIVGLYAGGYLSYEEGIYHPTGFCLMRGFRNESMKEQFNNETEEKEFEKTLNTVSNSFCPVCSYILIDHIDPLKHPSMNTIYGKYITL